MQAAVVNPNTGLSIYFELVKPSQYNAFVPCPVWDKGSLQPREVVVLRRRDSSAGCAIIRPFPTRTVTQV